MREITDQDKNYSMAEGRKHMNMELSLGLTLTRRIQPTEKSRCVALTVLLAIIYSCCIMTQEMTMRIALMVLGAGLGYVLMFFPIKLEKHHKVHAAGCIRENGSLISVEYWYRSGNTRYYKATLFHPEDIQHMDVGNRAIRIGLKSCHCLLSVNDEIVQQQVGSDIVILGFLNDSARDVAADALVRLAVADKIVSGRL